MKVVVAIDSFKGSISSYDAGCAVSEGIKSVYKNADVKVFSVADGGEGTVFALGKSLGCKTVKVMAKNPLGKEIECTYAIKGDIAIIEMASSSGITLLKKEELNPLNTTTFGVGQIIKDAISKGCRRFYVGIGGSATNDGGVGMLQALGFKILDSLGNQVEFGAKGLEKVYEIKADGVLPKLSLCDFTVACDVGNPLLGENGCSKVFGPQKGANREMTEKMDLFMANFAKVVKKYNKNSDPYFPGAGAAGGLGFAFLSFLSGKLKRGIDVVFDILDIEKDIKDADIVVTGEGRLDSQSVMGKLPVGVASLSKKYSKPVVAFSGSATEDATVLNEYGIDSFFPVLRSVCTLDEAMNFDNAYKNIVETSKQVFRLIYSIDNKK